MKEQLPGFILAGLFSNTLVDTGDKPQQKISEEILPEPKKKEDLLKPKKNYLGNYEKRIIVIVNDAENIYLDDESLNFLSGILSACKLNVAHIAIINFDKNAVDFNQLKKEMQPEFLLLFGTNALQIQLPFTMPDYQVQQYNNCKILISPSLIDLNQTTQKAKDEKGKLWKSLKKMFDLA